MVLITVAVIGNEFYKQTTTVTLAVGEHVALGGFDLEYAGLETNRESNLTEFVARMVVYNEGSNTPLDTVTPRRNIYDKTPDMPTSEVGLRMTPIEDVYVVLNGWDDRGRHGHLHHLCQPADHVDVGWRSGARAGYADRDLASSDAQACREHPTLCLRHWRLNGRSLPCSGLEF
jgi:hypothetical protein